MPLNYNLNHKNFSTHWAVRRLSMKPVLFVFDMGDVIIKESHVWHDVFSNFGLDVRNIRELGPNATLAVQRALVGKTEEKEFWSLVEKDVARKLTWEGVLEASYSCYPIEGSIQIIRSLLSKGFRVVCGTNNIRPFYNRIKAEGYYDIFPKVYSSFKIGISKPDPEFWRFIADQENILLKDMFFADDNRTNIEAAASLGVKTHQFFGADGLREYIERLGISL